MISVHMDILQKKTVKDLRAILREYKKIHCRPYSRLKKAQMIELIKHHGISEHDIEKTGKITSKREAINFGKDAFKPSNFSYDEVKELIQEEWFDNQLDFTNFFKTNTTFKQRNVIHR